MSVPKFRDERELKKAGLQLDPVTGEVAAIPQVVVWEMTDEQFEAHAARLSADQCATMIQEAKNQATRCFKRGAEWYYAAGRWLLWAKKKNAFAGWEGWVSFCQDECAISPTQASKYMKFASRFTPQDVAAFSFGDERFSLERALGYEDDSTGNALKQKRKAVPDAKGKAQVKKRNSDDDDETVTNEETTEPDGDNNVPGADQPIELEDNGGETEQGDEPTDDLADEEEKEFKEFEASIRKLTPKTKAVAIHHAMELLRDDLKGQEVDDELQETFGQIAQLAEELKGKNQQVKAA